MKESNFQANLSINLYAVEIVQTMIISMIISLILTSFVTLFFSFFAISKAELFQVGLICFTIFYLASVIIIQGLTKEVEK
jgi:cytosine/uracil/thiamine/allantoin permease